MGAERIVRLLGFVNHIPPAADVEDSIDRALEWGVDYIVAQGTGSDWGAHWLGSGERPAVDLKSNLRPYLRVAAERRIPFLISVGIAGARPHLEQSLAAIDELCREEGRRLRLGLLDTEIEPRALARAIAAGRRARRAVETDELPAELSAADAKRLVRAVGLAGPEPLVELLADQELDGIVTGRALDIALFMAPLLARGIPRALAAHAGKLLECGGLALEPGDSAEPIWAEVSAEAIEVRSPNPRLAPTPRSLASHSFYERSDPHREKNPGGTLDLSAATYEALPGGGVRCAGARWEEDEYTVLVEGAELRGYRALSVMGVAEPALLARWDEWIAAMRRDVAASPRFAPLREGVDYTLTVRTYGDPDAAAAREGPDPERQVGAIVDVVASTRELAEKIAYFAFIRLFIGPYPDRKSTAGNAAVPFMPVVIPAGPVYAFGAYHLLPVERPDELFRIEPGVTFPREGVAA